MFEALQKLADSTAKAVPLLDAIKMKKPHAAVIVKAHHRWGKTVDEAKQLHQDWNAVESKAVVDTMLKPLR